MESKKCVEYIDYGFSLYTINHDVYKITIDKLELTQTIGKGHHDVGALPDRLYIRLYNYPYEKFPSKINRDENKLKIILNLGHWCSTSVFLRIIIQHSLLKYFYITLPPF